MAVRRRRGKWVADFRDAGGVRRWITCDTRAEADEAEARGRHEARQKRRSAIDPSITVDAYARRWLALCAATLKPATLDNYEGNLRVHVLPSLGARKLVDLRRVHVKEFLAGKIASGELARSTAGIVGRILGAMLAQAVEEGVLLANPAAALGRALRLGDRTRTAIDAKAMDEGQLGAFLEAARTREPEYFPLFVVGAFAGLRRGELLGLRWDDLDFSRRTIHVERQALVGGGVGTPKSGKAREVDMAGMVADVLGALRAQRRSEDLAAGSPADPWVLVPGIGDPPKASLVAAAAARLKAAMHRSVKAAGLPGRFTVHCLRHTFASLLLAEGVSPAYVQEQLGHASIEETVGTYGRWLRKRAPGAVDQLAERVGSRTVADRGEVTEPEGGYLYTR